MPFAETWMELETITQSEVSQKELKKEQNCAICRDVDGTRDHHTE